ncbi:MAG: AraC family transcriptional regulator [Leucobacter sp.]
MPVWDTSALPAAEQFEYYHQVICRAFVPLLPVAAARRQGFASTVETRPLGELNRASVASPMQATHHGAAEVSATEGAYYFVNLQLAGRCRARQGSAESIVEPGQFTVLDTTEPFHLDFDRDWRMLSFRIPHEHLDARVRRDRIPLAAAIGQTGAGSAAIALIRALWSMHDELPEAAHADLELSFSAAVAGALAERSGERGTERSWERGTAPGAGPGDAAGLAGGDGLRAVISRYLEERIGDPSVSVDSVSRAFALSPRALHSLFEGGDETFAATLRTLRMRRAAELLADPAVSVTAVGAAVGYSDPSSFARVFRRFHGEPPRAFRASHESSSAPARTA